MDDLSMRFNTMIMREMGIEVGARERLYDQDTGHLIQFDGKDFVAPGAASGREAQEFDPYNSSKQMSQLFTYYANKLADYGEIEPIDVIYSVDGNNGKGKVIMKDVENTFSSAEYFRDQCKYADLLLQINGSEESEISSQLKEFDIYKPKESVKKKTTKKKETKKK